jgi:hypothetical protein
VIARLLDLFGRLDAEYVLHSEKDRLASRLAQESAFGKETETS